MRSLSANGKAKICSKQRDAASKNLRALDLDTIILRCRAESRGELDVQILGSTTPCYELFRRAVEEGLPEAWDAIYHQYRRLVLLWIGPDLPDVDEIVNRAFAKFWRFCPRESFSKRFPTLCHILSYLRQCAISARQEALRQRVPSFQSGEGIIAETLPSTQAVEDAALNNVVKQQLKELVWERLKSDRERRVMHLSYEIGLTPSEICARFPREFPSVDEVRRIKERILKRLRRDPELQTWWENSK